MLIAWSVIARLLHGIGILAYGMTALATEMQD